MSVIENDTNRKYCSMDDSLIELLIIQISNELYNKHLYLTFANFYDTEGLPKLAEYYKLRAKEEENHQKWIVDFLNYNDVCFQFPAVKEIDVNIENKQIPFNITIDAEVETTNSIYNIINKALELKDYMTFNWIMGNGPTEGNLCSEQCEEESISRTIAEMSQDSASWLIKENSIYNFYINSRK